MKARYIRVSTKNQNTARQEAKKHPDEKTFTDIISGTIPFRERPEAKQLLLKIALKEITQVSVSSIDRLGRNTIDILNTIDLFNRQGVNLHVDNLGLDSKTADGKPNYVFQLITSVMASLSQMERDQLRERQLEGIEAAKKAGTYKGRVKGATESDASILKKYASVVKVLKSSPNMTNNLIAESLKLSPHTVKKVREILNNKASV